MTEAKGQKMHIDQHSLYGYRSLMNRLENNKIPPPKPKLNELLTQISLLKPAENPRGMSMQLRDATVDENNREEIEVISQTAGLVMKKFAEQISSGQSGQDDFACPDCYVRYAASDTLEALSRLNYPQIQKIIVDAFFNPVFETDARRIVFNTTWLIKPETISYLIEKGRSDMALAILTNNPSAGVENNQISPRTQNDLIRLMEDKQTPIAKETAVTVSLLKQKAGMTSPKLEKTARSVLTDRFKKLQRSLAKSIDRLVDQLSSHNLNQALNSKTVNFEMDYPESFPGADEWYAWLRLVGQSYRDFDFDLANRLKNPDQTTITAVDRYRLLTLTIQKKAVENLHLAIDRSEKARLDTEKRVQELKRLEDEKKAKKEAEKKDQENQRRQEAERLRDVQDFLVTATPQIK